MLKRFIGNLIVLALVVAGLAFVAAPGVAFFAIRAAADAGDTAGLARLIDFGAVRQSLRPQMAGRAEALAPAPSFLEDPVAAVRRQFEQNPLAAGASAGVDAYLSPAALAGLTRGEGRYAAERSRADAPPPPSGAESPWPRPIFWGVNRARLAVTDDGGSRTIFTFERRGAFDWRLTHIGLPDGAAPAVAAPPDAAADAPAAAAGR